MSEINIIIKKEDSPLEDALRQKEDEKHFQLMSMLEMLLKKLGPSKSSTNHPGGTGC